jgi:hypothetical protein
MKWAPNPYALAQLLSGETDLEPLLAQSGEELDKLLITTFVSQGRHRTVSEAFSAFQQVGELNETLTLEEAMRSPHINKAAIARSDDQFRLVAPALLRISDDIFEGHVFAASRELTIDEAGYRDPVQGLIGDCYLIAAMIALAWAAPSLMTRRLNESGFNADETPFFRWQFHSEDNESGLRGNVSATGQIPMAGKLPRYARSSSSDEFWPALLEKAYVIKRRPSVLEPSPADYQAINEVTNPPTACQTLVGGRVRARSAGSSEFTNVFSDDGLLGPRQGGQLESGVLTKPVMAWTFEQAAVDFWDKTGLWPKHAYAVLGIMRDSRHDHVVLRNPHGFPTKVRDGYAEGTWRASGRPITSSNDEVELNTGGVFAITRDMFFKHFEHVGWVELPPTQ